MFIIDARLPELDGFTLVQWIRENPKFTGAVILMLSPPLILQGIRVHHRENSIGTAILLLAKTASGRIRSEK